MENRRDTFQETGCERKEHELKAVGGEDAGRDSLRFPKVTVITQEWY